MDVKVLGPGCAKCKTLYNDVEKLIQQLGVDATLTKVEEIQQIMSYGILMTPGLVIDGKVVAAGRVPRESEITTWLTTAAQK